MAAEVGRQPWVVHPRVVRDAAGIRIRFCRGVAVQPSEGLLGNGVSETIGRAVLGSIIMFGFI